MPRHKLAATLAVVALASPAVAWAEDEPLPVQVVDAMNKAFGSHVDLGTLTIDKTVADSAAAEKSLLFLPGQLTDGIEPSDDPLIDVRDSAYPVSFSRRNP